MLYTYQQLLHLTQSLDPEGGLVNIDSLFTPTSKGGANKSKYPSSRSPLGSNELDLSGGLDSEADDDLEFSGEWKQSEVTSNKTSLKMSTKGGFAFEIGSGVGTSRNGGSRRNSEGRNSVPVGRPLVFGGGSKENRERMEDSKSPSTKSSSSSSSSSSSGRKSRDSQRMGVDATDLLLSKMTLEQSDMTDEMRGLQSTVL